MSRGNRFVVVLSVALNLYPGVYSWSADDGIPRTASGKPDLSGTYDIATLTPMQRPEEFGEQLHMTPEQAEQITQRRAARNAAADGPS
ncbi:MAG: hypothetical protein AAF529_14805, partial [Pseudomonadota bacterium]